MALLAFLWVTQKGRFPYPFTDNEGDLACLASQWASGVNRDTWTLNPIRFLPLALLARFIPLTDYVLHLYVLAVHWAVALLLVALARRWGWGWNSAWVSAVAYALLVLSPLFLPWTADSDLLMQPWLLAAFWAASSRSRAGWFGSGILFGLAFLSKPSALFFIPVEVVLLGWKDWARMRWALAGAGLALTPGWLLLLWTGPGGFLSEGRVYFSGAYFWSGWRYLIHTIWYRRWLVNWLDWVLLVYALPLGVLLFKRFYLRRQNDGRPLVLWAGAALVSASVSGYFFSYYFMSLIPPLALAFGEWVEKTPKKNSPVLRWGLLAALGLESAWLALPPVRHRLFLASQYDPVRYCEARQMGMDLRVWARPGDRLMAWTNSPQLYAYSGLPLGVVENRFINQLIWLPRERAALEGRFRKNPPRFFILRDSLEVIPPPDWLRLAVKRGYRLKESMGGLELFSRHQSPHLSRETHVYQTPILRKTILK
ncbi:MAG: hypothetical protein ACREL1_08910 [bacterium]